MSVQSPAIYVWSLTELIHCGLLRILEEERIGNKLGKAREILQYISQHHAQTCQFRLEEKKQ